MKELKLNKAQEKELEAINKELKTRLEKVLTVEQMRKVENFRPGEKGFPGEKEKDKKPQLKVASADPAVQAVAADLLASGEVAGKPFETNLMHRPVSLMAKRLLLVSGGSAKKFSSYDLRRIAGTAVRALKGALPELYFHFDSWRVNVGGALWVPAQIYIEEEGSDPGVGIATRFKAQSRIWDYAATPGAIPAPIFRRYSAGLPDQ